MTEPSPHDDQLGQLAEELQTALAAGEDPQAHALAKKYSVTEQEVQKLIVALRAMESANQSKDDVRTLAPPALPSDYELGAELGRGGMGIVYRAHQKSLARDVAVKVLRPGDLMFGDAIARFEREARSLARLRHRHIVAVHEVGKAGGFVYFTMDLVEGMSLQQLVACGQMTNTRTVKLLRQVASAVTYAHGQGVVHRDLKPANILVDGNDDAFVVDFGLARDVSSTVHSHSGASKNRTISGQMMGTPAYMSPEQALGDRDRIGEGSDIYALGAVLYECLTGKQPFHGMPLAQLMNAVITEDPVAPRKLNSKVPDDLEVICQTAMQKRIEDRYKTVQAMADDLERYSTGHEILARRRSRLARTARFVRRNKKPLLAAAIPAVFAIALSWVFLLPGLLQGRDIVLGEQLFAKGNEAGALLAYRSAFANGTQDDVDLATRTHYAHCLVNQAGTLRLRGKAASDEFQQLLAEARRVLSWTEEIRRSTGQLSPAEQAAEYEWQRIESVDGKFFNALSLPDEELQAMTARDMAGPGRAATVMLFAQWFANTGNPPNGFDPVACDAAIEVICHRRLLPAAFNERWDGRIRSHAFADQHGHYLESLLIDLIADESQPQSVRWEAAELLNESDTLPFTTRSAPDGRRATIKHIDLPRVVAAWRSLQSAPRQEAYRKQVEFVAEALFRDGFQTAPRIDMQWQRLRKWLEVRTGIFIRSEAQWAGWWATNKDKDPREWLLASLQWQVKPADLTPEMLVDGFRTQLPQPPAIPDGQAALHHLLTLTVDESLQVPRFVTGYLTKVEWERLLHRVPDVRHHVRVATIAYINGDPTPHLMWQTRRELGIDESFQHEEYISSGLGLRSLHIGLGREQRRSFQPGIQISVHGSLNWAPEGVLFRVWNRVHKYHRTYDISGIYPCDHEHGVGEVFLADASLHYPKNGQSFVEVLTVAIAETTGTVDSDWDLENWRMAAAKTIRSAANGETTAYGLATLASFLPLPEDRQAVAQMQAEQLRLWGAPQANFGRCARLLAGDASAMQTPLAEPNDHQGVTHPDASPSFWTRLALTSDVPVIRDYALEQLQNAPLLPAFARTLQAAMHGGATIPEPFRQRLQAEPGLFASTIRSSLWSVIGLLAGWLVMVLAGNRTYRARGSIQRRTAATVLWISAAVVAHYSVWVNGVEYHPAWIAHILSTVAIWVMCWRTLRNWSWTIAPLYWTAITVIHLTEGVSEPWWMPTLLLLGILRVQIMASQQRSMRRLAQAGYQR